MSELMSEKDVFQNSQFDRRMLNYPLHQTRIFSLFPWSPHFSQSIDAATEAEAIFDFGLRSVRSCAAMSCRAGRNWDRAQMSWQGSEIAQSYAPLMLVMHHVPWRLPSLQGGSHARRADQG